MGRTLSKFVLMVATLCLVWFGIAPAAIAQGDAPATDGTSSVAIDEAVQIDWNDFSFSDFDPTQSGGAISSEWNDEAGYRVGRRWRAGDEIQDVLKLGDLAGGLSPERLSLSQIGQTIGRDLTELSLDEFDLLADQTLSDLVEGVEFLGDFEVGEVAPIEALVEDVGIGDYLNTEIGSLAEIEAFGDLKLGQLGDALGDFKIGDIPNVELSQLEAFEGFKDEVLSEIPGLQDLPLGAFPNPADIVGGVVGRIDNVYGPAETDRDDTVSGSKQEGFSVACPAGGQLTEPDDAPVDDPKCAYLELDDLEDVGKKVQSEFEGKQWISGRYHEVEGGFGPLKWVPSPIGFSTGYEPTGRHPFGGAFKFVVWEPDETEGTVSTKLTFRWCVYIIGIGRTCTPYNQFSVPFISFKTNDYIFLGRMDGQGGATAAPDTSGSTPGGGTSFGNNPSTPGEGPCTGKVIDGVALDALADSLAKIESQGSGGYKAVGVPVSYTNPNTGATVSGRALGRYQMMSYLPEVQSRVGAQPGGEAWLNRIANGYKPPQSEINEYFPPEMQEEAFRDEIGQLFDRARNETDPTTGRKFAGDRLIERVGQMWFGGPGAPIDGGSSDALGRLSLKSYGEETLEGYDAQGDTSADCAAATGGEGSGEATGSYANPLQSRYPVTSEFGRRNIGCQRSKFHPAIDLGTPIGTPVGSSDGGTVQFAACGVSGYGCTVVVDHGGGRKTRYSHLDSISVNQGQKVSQGQIIAETGNTDGNTSVSTGPHLDFGIYEGDTTGPGQLPAKGTAVNPRTYIDF